MKIDSTSVTMRRIFILGMGLFLFSLISFTNSYGTTIQEDNTSIRVKQNAAGGEKLLNVVTSVAPITNIVQNIGGDKINLIGLVPEGINSHTFELIPSDTIKINDADLVIIDGLNLETNIEKIAKNVISKTPNNIQLLKLGDKTISKQDWIFDFSFPKEKGDPNPHLWLNVEYAIKFANLIRDKLIEMDPSNSQYYSENSNKYTKLLKQLDEGIKKSVETIPLKNRKLLTYHDSWAYFAPRYGMTVIGAIQATDFSDPSPKDIADLIDQVRIEKVPAIFASEVFPTNIVDQIAKEGNVSIVETLSDDNLPGNPGDNNHSYVGMMLENMKNMIIPLGGNIDALNEINPQNIPS
ncbi:MAG TPA: metal ABC transporter substrate-binding protein [Nitrososphaeraceae archaeon]|nr:metal ABC transporter substrate-binding protein [Nitrososphaeraceae archaeon]